MEYLGCCIIQCDGLERSSLKVVSYGELNGLKRNVYFPLYENQMVLKGANFSTKLSI